MSEALDPYRSRLLAFVEAWTREGTRVAIFGTGPHTDLLFERVPELDRVRVVAYLASRVSRPAPRYRGRAVRPLEWAATHADVVLCSSFVNEPRMAALAEPLPCKVVMSHVSPDDVRPAAAQAAAIYRPAPAGRRIGWPAIEGEHGALLRFAADTRVLDAVLEAYFPFVDPAEADLARALVRYVSPGASAVEIAGDSPRLAALLAGLVEPTGSVCRVSPSQEAGSSARQVSDGPSLSMAGCGARRPHHRTGNAPRRDPSRPGKSADLGRALCGPTADRAPDLLVLYLGDDAPQAIEVAAPLLLRARPVVLAWTRRTVCLTAMARLLSHLDRARYQWQFDRREWATLHEGGQVAGPSLLLGVPVERAAASRAAASARGDPPGPPAPDGPVMAITA